jgi:integral membrane protein
MTLTTIFRVIAFLEGLSYILLLFIAVPIKYINSDPQYVKMLGMPHGLLFMGYIALAIVLRTDNQWIKNNFFVVILASVIPFGTFVVEYKLKKFNNK